MPRGRKGERRPADVIGNAVFEVHYAFDLHPAVACGVWTPILRETVSLLRGNRKRL